MLIGVWLILILLIFSAVVKRSRRLLYDDFVINGSDEELLSELNRTASAYILPERRGRGVETDALRAYINRAYRVITKAVIKKRTLDEYERWLYDNHYILERHLKGLKNESFSSFPHAGGVPRIVMLARTVVAYGNCRVTGERVELAVETLNKLAPLTTKELNGLSSAFSFAILEKLAAESRKCVYCRRMFGTAVKGKNLVKKYLNSNLYLYYVVKTNKKLAARLENFMDSRADKFDNLDYVYSGLIIENNILTTNAVESLMKLAESVGDVTRFNLSGRALEKSESFMQV